MILSHFTELSFADQDLVVCERIAILQDLTDMLLSGGTINHDTYTVIMKSICRASISRIEYSHEVAYAMLTDIRTHVHSIITNSVNGEV